MAPLVSAIREPQRGGSQAFVSDLARGLGRRGHEVHVYAATGSEIPGVTVIDTGVDPASLVATLYRAAGPPGRDPAAAAAAFASAYSAVRQDRYDVIHNHAFDAPAISLATGLGTAGGAHAPPAARRGDRGSASPGRPGRPAPGCGLRVRVPGGHLARGRPGRRDPPAVRADRLGPLVGYGRGRRCFRRPAEPREGSRRGDRHRSGGRRPDRRLRRRLRRRVRTSADRPAARRARRGGAPRSAPDIDVGGHGPRCGRRLPGEVGRAVRHGCRRCPGVRDSCRRVQARRTWRDHRGWRDRLPGRAG